MQDDIKEDEVPVEHIEVVEEPTPTNPVVETTEVIEKPLESYE